VTSNSALVITAATKHFQRIPYLRESEANRMIDRAYIVKTLRQSMPLLHSRGVRSVGLFGSYARNEQTAASDVDLLVDFERGSENFDNLMAVCDLLESLFAGHRIEVVTKSGLSQHIGPRILQEVVYV